MTARYELEADAHGLPVRYPATPDTREDASGWYPVDESAADADEDLWLAMQAEVSL